MILQPSQMSLPQGTPQTPITPPQGPRILQPSQMQGYIPQTPPSPQNSPQTAPQGPQLTDTGSFMGNLGNSIENFGSSIGNAVMHPIQTVENLGKAAIGGEEKLAGHILGAPQPNDQFTQVADQIGNYIKTRYGSLEAAKTTAYQDPVGFLADASAILSGVGGAVGAAGDVADVSQVSDVGNAISKAGEVTNPINAVTKPIEYGSDLIKSGLGGLQDTLEKSNLRLTPAQQANFGAKIPGAIDWIKENLSPGNPDTRLEQASSVLDAKEDTFQNFLNTDAAGITTPRQDLLDAADQLKSEFRTDRDSLAINNQIDNFKKTLETNYPEQIPLTDLNELKRSTFASAFDKNGLKVSDAVEYRLGDLMKTGIQNATTGFEDANGTQFPNLKIDGKTVQEFNADYGNGINAKKLLKIASGRPQVGFVERLLGDAIGFSKGGPLGAVGAHLFESNAPISAAKSILGKVATGASNLIPKVKIPSTALNAVSRINKATQR